MFSDFKRDTEGWVKRTRRTDARLLRSWSYLVRMETNVAAFWMRFREVPWETDLDHFTLYGSGQR